MVKSHWNFFISHASEDKEDVARPLAELLLGLGFKVWYDEFSLKLGDSLNQSINRGLAQSDYGIVILSPNFFRKNWTQRELDGLVAQETIIGKKKILPIWHKVTAKKVAKYSSILADKKAILTTSSLENVVREIIRAVEDNLDIPEGLPSPAHDIILPNDILLAFRTIEEFKQEAIDNKALNNIYQALLIFRINTLGRLKELTSSQKIIDTLRQIYREELLRPEKNPFKPVEFATSGGYLLNQLVTPSSVNELRQLLQGTQEYQKTHPGTKVPPMAAVNLEKIVNGKQCVDLFSNTHVLISDYDQPSNDDEAALIRDLLQVTEDLDVLDSSDLPQMALEIDRIIRELQRHSFYVYGASKEGQYHVGDIVLDTNAVYLVISHRDIFPFIVLNQSNFIPK